MLVPIISQPNKMPSQTAGLLVLIGFALVVALLGGSSYPRVPQLIGLRPLAALFLIPVIYYWQSEKTDQERTLLMLLGGLTAWMLVQLIPVPQGLWSLMPDRDIVAELDGAVGLGSQWRPISWVPSRGMNALASLIVPAAALLLAIALRARSEVLLQIMLGVILLNALLAIVQVVSGNPESLYLYDPSSKGSDGLFGNENHSGVLSAIGLLIAARLAAQTDTQRQTGHQIVYGAAAMTIFLAALIGGSRAGLAAGISASAAALLMLFLSSRRAKGGGTGTLSSRSFILVSAVFLVAIAALFFWLDRSASFDGILVESTLEDLRWELNPLLWDMASKNWMTGIGFGAFEEYYHIYEPDRLLLPQFINLAHNDWAQLLLEGGIVAVALLGALLLWGARRLKDIFAQGPDALFAIVFWVAVFAVIAAASLVDYPMRTPIFQFVSVWLLVCLARDGTSPIVTRPQRKRSRRRER